MEWISVKDELPEDEQVIDVWMPEIKKKNKRLENIIFYKRYSLLDYRKNFFFQWNFNNETTIFLEENRITHWMPLPKPPNQSTDKESK